MLLAGLLILSVLLYSNNILTGPNLEANSSIALSFLFPSAAISYLLIRGNTLKGIFQGFGLSKEKFTLYAIAIGIALFFAIILFDLAVSFFSMVTNIQLPTNVQMVLQGTPTYFLIFTFIMAPVNEEIFFRGFLVPRIGIIFSAIIFAVLHLSYISASEFAAAFFFGLIAGYVYKKTKSLYPSIIAHMIVNFITIISLFYVGGLLIRL